MDPIMVGLFSPEQPKNVLSGLPDGFIAVKGRVGKLANGTEIAAVEFRAVLEADEGVHVLLTVREAEALAAALTKAVSFALNSSEQKP